MICFSHKDFFIDQTFNKHPIIYAKNISERQKKLERVTASGKNWVTEYQGDKEADFSLYTFRAFLCCTIYKYYFLKKKTNWKEPKPPDGKGSLNIWSISRV